MENRGWQLHTVLVGLAVAVLRGLQILYINHDI